MKKHLLIFTLVLSSTSVFVSCSKDNDAGILIDGNGTPRSGMRSANSVNPSGKTAATCTDPKVEADYGIAIDPDGRP